MLAKIGTWDITTIINSKTYDVNENREFEEWKDGNGRKHRIYTAGKVSGSFEVLLLNTTLQAFLNTWNNNASNDIIPITVYVKNTGENKPINAFFKITGNKHIQRQDNKNKYLDVITIEIEER